MAVEGGAALTVQAGAAPVVDGVTEERMRVGCGSAAIGMFAKQWAAHVDEVIVVDDHITGVLSEHQAGRQLWNAAHRHPRARQEIDAGPLFSGGRAGRRLGWHGHNRTRCRSSRRSDPQGARPGLTAADGLTTGEQPRISCWTSDCTPVEGGSARTAPPLVERVGRELRAGACARCCSWAAPAARCARASPKTPCG